MASMISGGWERFFADPSLVWPPEFESGEDPPPREHSALQCTSSIPISAGLWGPAKRSVATTCTASSRHFENVETSDSEFGVPGSIQS